MRQKWTGTLVHPSRALKVGRLRVLFAWSLGVPFLGSLLGPLSMLLTVRRACRKNKPDIVLLYNHPIGILCGGLLAKWLYGARVMLDVEDVCVSRWEDWIGRGDARPMQQLIGWFLLKAGVAMCDRVMVPSRKFIATGNIRKEYIVVGGCIAVEAPQGLKQDLAGGSLRVLISGKLDEEQGVWLVLEAIATLGLRPASGRKLEFHLCGFAENEPALKRQVLDLQQAGITITYHGTVAGAVYRRLLAGADICVAMQNPGGRHGSAKTPSKVYEYLAYGKVVVASEVGDFKELPDQIITLCRYDRVAVADQLRQMANEWPAWSKQGDRAARFAREEFSLRAVGDRILRSVSSGEDLV